jgi:Bacterial SH3 domain
MKPNVFCWLLATAMFPFFSQPVFAQDSIYVWARSGMNLRETPDFNGKKITTLPYGTLVRVVEYAQVVKSWSELAGDIEEPVVIQHKVMKNKKNNAAYIIEGSWVKVISAGKEGYVFDAYLSRMPPHKTGTMSGEESIDSNLLNLHTYLQEQIGLAHQASKLTVYKDGTSVHGSGQLWIFPEIGRHDGYLLINYFFNLENCVAKGKKGAGVFLKDDWEEGDYELEFEYEINSRDGFWLIIDFWEDIMRIKLDEDGRC